MGCVRIMQTYGVSGIKLKSASSCLPHTLTPPSSLPCSHLFPPSSVFTSPTRSLFPHPLPPLYLANSFNLSPPPPPTNSSLLPRSFTHSFPTPLPSSLISLTHFTHLLLSHAPPSSLLISLTHSFTLSYTSPTISRSLLPPLPPPPELERSTTPHPFLLSRSLIHSPTRPIHLYVAHLLSKPPPLTPHPPLYLAHSPPPPPPILLTPSLSLPPTHPPLHLAPPPPPPPHSFTHTPSIAFRHFPPKEGCRKPVLGVCPSLSPHPPLYLAHSSPVPYIVHSFIFSQPPSLSRSLTPPPLYLSLSPLSLSRLPAHRGVVTWAGG